MRGGRDLDVLGNVDHAAGPGRLGGDMEGLAHRRGEPRRILHQIIVLGAVAGDADRVGFLKRVGADQRGRDLAGDDDHRDRIHQRIGDAGDRVVAPGPEVTSTTPGLPVARA